MFVYKTFYLHAKVQNKIQNSVIQCDIIDLNMARLWFMVDIRNYVLSGYAVM